MPFSARNARYLRISAHTVLPLYIYLDDKHLQWMSDYTLQRVLEDLRPVIGPKLRAESSLQSSGGSAHAKKGTVDVHRGDTYQFAYFFRKNEPHAVLLKSRKFIPTPALAAKRTSIVEPQLLVPIPKKRKRGGSRPKPPSPKSVPRASSSGSKKIAEALSDSDGHEMSDNTGDERDAPHIVAGERPRRSRRKKKIISGGYQETDRDDDAAAMVDSDHDPAEVTSLEQDTGNIENADGTSTIIDPHPESGSRFTPLFDIDAEGEEEKPKLAMRVSYQGFTIYDRCLCVVVEPWPPLRETSRASSVAPHLALENIRVSSEAPTELRQRTPIPLRERTPLFLPELDPRRSLTPAPLPSRFLPPVPLYDQSTDPEDEEKGTNEFGMMAFSQILKSVSGERAGSADEDENEGDAFLGDADERRGPP